LKTKLYKKLALQACLVFFSFEANAAMTFTVNFTAQAQSDLSAADQAKFTDGLAYWDSVILDHQDNQSRNWILNVDTFNTPASGGFVTLGSAGPSSIIVSNVVPGSGLGGSWPNRFLLSGGGNASFNIHPEAGTLRASTVLHEIGHALGIGTLWEDNEVYNDGNAATGNRTGAGNIGEYTGANALAAYQAEFIGQGAVTFIPVEQGGGGGTANGHWNEVDGGGGLTGIVDASGNDFRDELMTGWASPVEANTFVSNTTLQSLRDIGFTLEVAAIPEPSALLLLGLGSMALVLRRRR
jgi:hypothetical protein